MAQWQFDGQTVAITGGGGGIGSLLAERFAAAGANVYACGRSASILESARHPSIRASAVDVTDAVQVREWIRAIAEESRRVDVLVNAAGICPVVSVEETDPELWDRIVDVNLKGTFLPSQAVIPLMKQHGFGRIVNFSSIAAFTGGSIVSAAYAAAKGGVVSLTKAMAHALSPSGITVNCVAPGPARTSMIADFPPELMRKLTASTPNRRLGEAEDVAHAVLFLADRDSSHLTGATIDVNGGLHMR